MKSVLTIALKLPVFNCIAIINVDALNKGIKLCLNKEKNMMNITMFLQNEGYILRFYQKENLRRSTIT